MKKIQTIFLSAVALFAASCSSEVENEITPEPASKHVVLRATIEGAGTRAAIDNGKVNWQAGDAISVRLSDDKNLLMTVTKGSVGNTSATFEGTLVGEATIEAPTVAVYPAGNHNLKKNETVVVNMPAEYTVTDNENTNMPMLCEFDATGSGTFKHLGGVIRFKIGMDYVSESAAKFRFTTKDGQNITGDFNVEEEDGNNVIKATSGDGTLSSVTVTFNRKQIENNILYVNVPLPVGTYVGMELDILDAEGNKLVKTIESNATNTVARTKRVVMPKLTPVKLTAGTEDPDPEIPDNGIPVDNNEKNFDGTQSGDGSND